MHHFSKAMIEVMTIAMPVPYCSELHLRRRLNAETDAFSKLQGLLEQRSLILPEDD